MHGFDMKLSYANYAQNGKVLHQKNRFFAKKTV